MKIRSNKLVKWLIAAAVVVGGLWFAIHKGYIKNPFAKKTK